MANKNKYSIQSKKLTNAEKKYKNMSYNSKYEKNINNLTGKVTSPEPFEYDAKKDSAYQAYRDQLIRENKKAARSAAAQANANSGGWGTTYGAAVAGQSYRQGIEQLSSALPQYTESAYSRYRKYLEDLKSNLNTVLTLDDIGYSRYKDRRNDAYNNMSYIYGKNTDNRNFNYQRDLNDRSFDYQKYIDNRNFNYQKNTDNRNFNYQKALNDRDYNFQREQFGYQKQQAADSNAYKYNDTVQEKYNQMLKSAASYAQLLWEQNGPSTIEKTFNYIKSLGLKEPEVREMVKSLGNKSKKSALYWYTKLGYDKK